MAYNLTTNKEEGIVLSGGTLDTITTLTTANGR